MLSAVALFVAGSLIVPVTLIHLPHVLIVVVGTGLVRSTATKGTVRMLLGLVTLVATWTVAGMWLADGWAALGAGVAVAVGRGARPGGVAAAVPPGRVLVGRVKVRDRVGLVPPVIEARSPVVAAVRDSLGTRR